MINYSMPKQKLSFKTKTTGVYQGTERPWGELCIDSVIALSSESIYTRRSTAFNKKRNYDALNNKIEESDFYHVTRPFNLRNEDGSLMELKFPATLQPYDILSRIFKLLLGEEASRFFSPIVKTVDPDSLSEKSKMEKEAVLAALTEILKAEIEGNPEQQPEKLLKYAQYSIKDLREKQATDLLEYYKPFLRVDEKFQEGMKDWLVAGEEIYRVDKVHEEPKLTRVNPLEVSFILPSNTNYIDKATKICEHNRLSIAEIIDEFYEILTPAQIDELEDTMSGVYNFQEYAPIIPTTVDSINSLHQYNGDGMDVWRCRWKSFRCLKIVHYYDEQGQEQEEIVDETFVNPDPSNPNMWVEEVWVPEYWQGIRIGADLYLQIQPMEIRFGSANNLAECSSGYIGTLCDSANSQSTSLMDRLMPWLYLFLVTAFRLELLMATNWSKIAMIDVSLIPDGWDPEKWMWYAMSMKFGFVNSYNEGKKGERKGQFNDSDQNKSLDLEQGNSIQHYVYILDWIQQKIADTSGVSEQRMGQISSNELVGNTERSVVQSSHITEELFMVHNLTKIRVLTAILEVAKECLAGKNKTIQCIVDETTNILTEIDGDAFSSADYGVFISNNPKDHEALKAFKEHMQAALQNDKIEFSDIADIYTTNSIAVIKNKLKEGEIKRQQRAQAQEQAQQEHEQMLQQFTRDMQDDAQLHDAEQRDLDRQNAIYLAELKAIGQDSMASPEDNTPTIVETGELALSHLQLAQDNIKHSREMNQKDKELKAKIEIENKKLKQIEVQNKSQEKIANQKAKQDKIMMDQKIKLEGMKARAAIAKAKRPTPKSK